MSFRAWLRAQVSRPDAVGDLARTLAADPSAPTSCRGVERYIRERDVQAAALALTAWRKEGHSR